MTRLKGTSVKSEPTCYKLETGILGIDFELTGKAQLFAPYSFLSHVKMEDHNEISLHYTYGLVRITGHQLQPIYDLVKKSCLGLVRASELHDPCRGDIEVREIIFEDAKAIE